MNDRSAKSIFLAAIEQHQPETWTDFLDQACGDDRHLRADVDRLLEGHRQLGTFHEQEKPENSSQLLEAEGTTIERYKLLEKIGEGGMGIVYMASQISPIKRKVALKIIKPGMDTKQVVARFEAERQALGLMEHPNIARVLDGGSTPSGRPYFVMELVRGIPITEYCDKNKLNNRVRLKLFTDVCQAIQHAHQKGIIHRDIKPGNALVTLRDGVPIVKVIDFGVAKALNQELTERTLFTKFSQMIGTPIYMSPEQAEMSELDVDTRSDIYSLGVLLYELLTGTTPLDADQLKDAAYVELQRLITNEESPKPSTRLSTLGASEDEVASKRSTDLKGLKQFVAGDLDWIVMKALDKDRNRRYESASGFADDIERFLAGDAIEARPPSTAYRFAKFIGRNRGKVIAASLISATFVLGLVGTTIGLISARIEANAARQSKTIADQERKTAVAAQRAADVAKTAAEKTAQESRRRLYASNMQLADQLWRSGDGTPREIQDLLAAWIPTDNQPDLREFVWRLQWTRLHLSAERTRVGTVTATIAPDGLLFADQNGIHEWDRTTDTLTTRWKGDASAGQEQVALSPCGRWAAIRDGAVIRLIEIATGNVIREMPGERARFAAGGDYVLVFAVNHKNDKYHAYELWSVLDDTHRKITDLEYDRGFLSGVGSISPDGQTVLIASGPHGLAVHDATSTKTDDWKQDTGVECTAWSSDSQVVATGHFGGNVYLRFVDSARDAIRINTGRSQTSSLAFSNDGYELAIGTNHGHVDLYDVSAIYGDEDAYHAGLDGDGALRTERDTNSLPKLVRTINAHVSRVDRIVFSHDNSRIVTHDVEGTAKLWHRVPTSNVFPMVGPVEFSWGGNVGVELENDTGVLVSHVRPERHETVSGDLRPGDRIQAIIDDSGRHDIESNRDEADVHRLLRGRPNTKVTLRVFAEHAEDIRTVELLRKKMTHRPARYLAFAFANDNDSFVVATREGPFRRTIEGEVLKHFPTPNTTSVAVSSDGRLLAYDDCKELVLWDLTNDQLRARLDARPKQFPTTPNEVSGAIAFSPDGRFIAMGTGNRMVIPVEARPSELKVWDVATQTEIGDPLFENRMCISSVAFTSDSQELCATDHHGVVRIWDTLSWEMKQSFQGLYGSNSVVVSGDGQWLAQGGENGIVIWDRYANKKQHVIRGETATRLAFSTTGATLVATRLNGNAIFLDTETGMLLATVETGQEILADSKFSDDGNTLAVLCWTGDISLYPAAGLDDLDQHPLTVAALYRRAMDQLQDEKLVLAERTLRRVYKLQRNTLPDDHDELAKTKHQLIRLLDRQGQLPHVVIARHPTSQSVALGEPASLSVVVKENSALQFRYQWYFDGAPIQHETEDTLSIERVSPKDLGRYRVEVVFGEPGLEIVERSDVAVLRDRASYKRKYRAGLRRELFLNIEGGTVLDLRQAPSFPHKPDESDVIDSFELPSNFGDNYGARITGFLLPPKTGDYVFYLCSDDSSELYLSTDETKDNKRAIASLRGWKNSRQWEELDSDSISKPIRLELGKRYWIEAIFKESKVGDKFAVTWQKPDKPPPKNGDPPIPGEFLEHCIE